MPDENEAVPLDQAQADYAAAVAAHEGPKAALVELEQRLEAAQPVGRDERRAVNDAYQQSEAVVNEARIALVNAERAAAAAAGEPVEVGEDQTVGG